MDARGYIPVVDFTAYGLEKDSQSAEPDSLKKLASEIHTAFTTIGFVYLKNHGISESLINEANNKADEFFVLPDEIKSNYARTNATNHGWVCLEAEGFNPNRPARDLKEAYNICPFAADVWPDADVPHFRRDLCTFFDVCSELTHRILDVMAIGLELEDRSFFRKRHNVSTGSNLTTLRMLHYPPLDNHQVKEGQLRCGEHSDYGSITLLFQDSIGGLEVRHRDGYYVPATPIPGTVVVNIGDLMQRWTSDKLVSTKHRVVNPETNLQKSSPRKSIAFYSQPDSDCVITCIDGSEKYEPITSLQHLDSQFKRTY